MNFDYSIIEVEIAPGKILDLANPHAGPSKEPVDVAVRLPVGSGKDTVEQWFFGQVMRRLRGRGNPQIIRQALAAALEQTKQIIKPG